MLTIFVAAILCVSVAPMLVYWVLTGRYIGEDILNLIPDPFKI